MAEQTEAVPGSRDDFSVEANRAGVDVEERVAALVQARRPDLEQLVRQAVDRELRALVDQELQHRNGNGAGVRSSDAAENVDGVQREILDIQKSADVGRRHLAEARLCRVCGEREAQQHRTVCGRCRERQKRDRRATKDEAQASSDEARPAATRTRGGYLLDRRTLEYEEQRRQAIAAAPAVTVERDGRTWTLRRLPPAPAAAVMLRLTD